jgi:hypothetical protein
MEILSTSVEKLHDELWDAKSCGSRAQKAGSPQHLSSNELFFIRDFHYEPTFKFKFENADDLTRTIPL